MSNDELAALYHAAVADTDPREVLGYEKASELFTQYDGTRMHPDTLAAFGVIVAERLK